LIWGLILCGRGEIGRYSHIVSVQCRLIYCLHSVLVANPSTFMEFIMLLIVSLFLMHSSHCRCFGVSCSYASYVYAHCDGHSQHELHAHTGIWCLHGGCYELSNIATDLYVGYIHTHTHCKTKRNAMFSQGESFEREQESVCFFAEAVVYQLKT
jgi:hypothetical protein